MSNSFSRRLVPLVFPALVAGCAALPADHGRGEVASLLKERGRDVSAAPQDQESVRKILGELSGRPLSIHDAVRIALVGNPRLGAEYARLGIAAAEVYDAGRLSNPRLSFAYLFVDEAGLADKIDLGLAQNFTDLLLLPARKRFAAGEFERVQRSVAAEIHRLAAEVESAYYTHVGAQQVAEMRETVAKAAQVSAELAERFFAAGNINRLELSREQAAATQAGLVALQAQAEVARTSAALARLMGAPTHSTPWSVDPRLPAPVNNEDELEGLLRLADQSRLDLVAGRRLVELQADALGVTRRFRYLGDIEVGVQAERDTDRTKHLGPTLSLELPLFNQGAGRVTRAEAELHRAEAELAELEIDVVTGIQATHAEVHNARIRAERYRAKLIPQREDIVRLTGEQVNYMLVGQFELLLSKQQEYDAYQGYLEAVRDYWVARTELMAQVGAPLPSAASAGEFTLDVQTLIRPKEPPMDHGGMPMDHRGHDMKDMKPGQKMDHDMKDMEQQRPDMRMDHDMKDTTKPKDEGDHSGHQMPSGMESHIPETKKEKKASPKKPEVPEEQPHQHGDPQ